MPYNLSWIVENRIIFIQNKSESSEEEIRSLADKVKLMYAEGTPPIHAIEDDRDFNGVSDVSLDLVQSIFEVTDAIDYEKMSWAVVIVPEELTEISDMFGKIGEVITDLQYHRVESIPEALDFLSEHDATLPEKKEWALP